MSWLGIAGQNSSKQLESVPTKADHREMTMSNKVVRPAGAEPAACGFEVGRLAKIIGKQK